MRISSLQALARYIPLTERAIAVIAAVILVSEKVADFSQLGWEITTMSVVRSIKSWLVEARR